MAGPFEDFVNSVGNVFSDTISRHTTRPRRTMGPALSSAPPSGMELYRIPGSPFTIDRRYLPNFQGLLKGLEDAGYAVDPGQSGGYNPRNVAGTNTPSNHAFGRAIDVNWRDQPRGGKSTIDPDLARRLAKENGLTWGGDWSKPDPMHFEGANGAPVPVASRSLTAYAGLGGPKTPSADTARPQQEEPVMPPRSLDDDPYRSNLFGSEGFGALVGGVKRAALNPLTIAGLSIMRGGDPQRALSGATDQSRRYAAEDRALAETEQRNTAWRGLLDDPSAFDGMSPPLAKLARTLPPAEGGELVAKSLDPNRILDTDVQRANLAKTKAETNALTQKDRLTDWIMSTLSENGQPPSMPFATAPSTPSPPSAESPSAPSTSPSVSPQSMPFGTGVPRTGVMPIANDDLPGIWSGAARAEQPYGLQNAQYIEAQDATVPEGPPPAGVNGNEDLVQTPWGPMTRDKARRLGGAMLFDPRYAPAGKEFLESSRAVAPGMGRAATNALQEKQFNTVEQFARLKSIEQSWKPEYQTIEKRLGFAWDSLLDKFSSTRKSITPQQRQELAAYSANKAEALNNLNQYIKEITGAAMTNSEAVRIKNSQADPGEGIFDGDSPTVFDAKLQANIRMTKMALARFNYLTRRGFPPDAETLARELSLDDMPKVIQQRTDQLLKQSLSQNPGATPQDVAPIVRQRLRAEFGIDA